MLIKCLFIYLCIKQPNCKPCRVSLKMGASTYWHSPPFAPSAYPNSPTGGVVLNGDRQELFGVDDDAGPDPPPPDDRIEFVLYLNSPDILLDPSSAPRSVTKLKITEVQTLLNSQPLSSLRSSYHDWHSALLNYSQQSITPQLFLYQQLTASSSEASISRLIPSRTVNRPFTLSDHLSSLLTPYHPSIL